MKNKSESKETWVIIVLLAITLTLFFISLSDNSRYYNLITGRTTDTALGSANVTVSAVTQLNVSTGGAANNTNISFGTGYVLQGHTYCAMSSQSTTLKSSGCSSGLASPGVNFTIQNIGNTNLTVNVSADKGADEFIGGTSPVFNYQVSQGSESGCTGTIAGATNWFAFNTSAAGATICTELYHVSTADTMQLAINVSIPENSKTGSLGAMITFTGVSA